MTGQQPNQRSPILPAILIGAASWYVLDFSGPILAGPQINPVSAAAGLVLGASGLTLLSSTFRFLGDILEWLRARKPIGLKGTAGWIRHLRELRHELVRKGWGPYWGSFKSRELIIDYASNALTVSPAGTKKDVGVVQPTVLAIRHSKTVIDFKGTSACVLADTLRERGEIVRILNLGDVWEDILGPSDTYNPLCLIADDYWVPGGLQDVTDDVYELCMQLYPEPAGGGGKDDNRYFRDGSRTLIGFAIQMCVLIKGYDATLGDVAQMLNDRASLLQHARWAAGQLEIDGDEE